MNQNKSWWESLALYGGVALGLGFAAVHIAWSSFRQLIDVSFKLLEARRSTAACPSSSFNLETGRNFDIAPKLSVTIKCDGVATPEDLGRRIINGLSVFAMHQDFHKMTDQVWLDGEDGQKHSGRWAFKTTLCVSVGGHSVVVGDLYYTTAIQPDATLPRPGGRDDERVTEYVLDYDKSKDTINRAPAGYNAALISALRDRG